MMRVALAFPLLILSVAPGITETAPRMAPGPERPAAAADRDEARWADWEAQSRIEDGDYDGAVQAQKKADTDRREADRQDSLARAAGQ